MNKLIVGKRAALSNWLRQFFTVIDPENKKYKIQEGLLGIFKWGSFISLPKIDYVLIFKSLFVKCESCSIDEFENNPNAFFQVSLVYNHNRRIIVHETQDKDEAFDLAGNLASSLKIRIKDSATSKRQSTWK